MGSLHLETQLPEIRKFLAEDMTLGEIAHKLHCEERAVRRCLIKHDLDWNRKTGPRGGFRSKLWKGGRRVRNNGYVEIFAPDHPSCVRSNARRISKPNDRSYNRKRYVDEHRLVMEAHLGRYLDDCEVVHHKNGDHGDNRIENLELFSSNAEHLRHELKGRCPEWTKAGIRSLQSSNDRKRCTPLVLSAGSDDLRYTQSKYPTKRKLQTSARRLS